MNTTRQRNIRRLGLAGLLGTAALLAMSFAPPADAAPRDRRGSNTGHAERGHERGHADRRGDVDRHRRWDGDRRRHDARREERRHDRRHGVEHRRHAHFAVPRSLPARHPRDYGSYYRGRRFSRAHGHYHAVYAFPVATHWGYEVRAHDYCGGHLFGGGYLTYNGRHFDIGLRF